MPRIDALFDQVLAAGASDLHLSVGHPPLARVRGELVPIAQNAVDQAELEGLVFELLTPDQRTQLSTSWDLDFAWQHGDRARFRGHCFMKLTGPGAVFRFVPARAPTLQELGFPDAIRKLCERRSGLVIVSGATGSGKSTTLAAMVAHINQTRACHVLTVEEPVEFLHTPQRAQVTHREIGPHAPSYPAALASAPREDANVVLVGDLRSADNIRAALALAASGVLVLGAGHSPTTGATIERIINTFPSGEQQQVRGLVADNLVGLVVQQLVRSADGKSRIAVHEILVATGKLPALVREGKTAQIPGMIQMGAQQGMQLMDAALEKLVIAQRVTPEEALERATDREMFQAFLARFKQGGAEATAQAPAEATTTA